MQKRSNPFENVETPSEQEDVKVIQKRINPLTLDTQPAEAEQPVHHEPVFAQEKRPTTVSGGKIKRKRVWAAVNKAFITELVAATGKKPAEVIDSALLCYAYLDCPKAYLRAKTTLESKGCEIK